MWVFWREGYDDIKSCHRKRIIKDHLVRKIILTNKKKKRKKKRKKCFNIGQYVFKSY